MTTIHDFNEQLAYSERASCEPFWNAVYRKAFPNMVNHMICSGNTQSQRMGVDRIVYLGNDKEIRIDEKKRKKSYGDVILEYISVDTTGAPGWIEKDLAIDYLAYAIMTTKQCYLFPWQLLRRVWCRFGREWIELAEQNERALAEKKANNPQFREYRNTGFRIVEAKNWRYSTWSVAIPANLLRQRVAAASIIDVSNELQTWEYEE